MTFARMLNDSNTTLTEIYHHSYNQELQAGTLSRQLFKSYLEQDALYLRELANSLKLLVPRLDDKNHQAIITKLFEETIHYEKTMLSDYLGDPLLLFAPPVPESPVISDYTKYLLHAAEHEPVEVAVASILPCFWIYSELGQQMSVNGIGEHHPYRKWIVSYANKDFFAVADALKTMTETLAADSVEQDAMVSAFVKSANYELAFYEQTYPHHKPVVRNTLTQTI
jgi:thiaminase (transcriptional activator TenA)